MRSLPPTEIDLSYFPAFYADKRYDRRHLEAITKLLGDLPDGAKLQFFLNPKGIAKQANTFASTRAWPAGRL
jgi:hypothetical protein